MTTCDTRSIVDWLADGARSAQRPDAMLEQLCDRIVQAGIPLWRVSVFVRTLHPEIAGRRFVWQTGRTVTIDDGTFDIIASEDFRNSPDLVKGDSIGDELVRSIRQISQVKKRLKELQKEKQVAEVSELYTLRNKMQAEAAEGRDMIKQMAARTAVQIKKSERRLENLRLVNKAAEEHVKDKYGMDISAFR